MDHIYLCGHTGSENRGCEAILCATAALLKKQGIEQVSAMTFDPAYDRQVGLDRRLELIPYPQKNLLQRSASWLWRKLSGSGVWGAGLSYDPLFRTLEKNAVLFNVGGDTYCYGTPSLSYALNKKAQKNNVSTVFWGCSVDERVIHDRQMNQDVNRYRYILAREKKSYDLLKQAVTDKGKVLLACDPAFHLEAEPVALPQNFQPQNMVGINISPFVMRSERKDDIICRNVYYLIDRILEETDMGVCLIPHVYDTEKNSEDIRVLRYLYRRYAKNSRVSLVEKNLSCTQLKYIISQCRFFIGARTHTVIAAYSTGIPALAVSYSVKSLGIAEDIFGTWEGYAIPWKDIRQEDELWQTFRKAIMENETAICQRYAEVLPGYKASIEKAMAVILQKR